MATADEAISMLSEVLLMDAAYEQGAVTLSIYRTPAEELRLRADELDRKEAIRNLAWTMVRSHRKQDQR